MTERDEGIGPNVRDERVPEPNPETLPIEPLEFESGDEGEREENDQ